MFIFGRRILSLSKYKILLNIPFGIWTHFKMHCRREIECFKHTPSLLLTGPNLKPTSQYTEGILTVQSNLCPYFRMQVVKNSTHLNLSLDGKLNFSLKDCVASCAGFPFPFESMEGGKLHKHFTNAINNRNYTHTGARIGWIQGLGRRRHSPLTRCQSATGYYHRNSVPCESGWSPNEIIHSRTCLNERYSGIQYFLCRKERIQN